MKFGPALMAQADALARFTADAPRITRTYLSPEHKAAGEYLIALMRAAGMQPASTRWATSSVVMLLPIRPLRL